MANRKSTARDLAQIAIFAALIAALGLPGTIYIGANGVPITLQTLGVMLAGAILGARKGLLSVVVFLVLAIAGLPIMAGGRTGLTALAGPSAGYVVGWLFGVVVIGLLTARILPKYPLWQGIAINLLGGVLVIYAFGITWAAIRTDWASATANTLLFLPGDLVKAIVTALVAKQVHRSYPGLMPGVAWTSSQPPTEKVAS